jgi:hypothetical protein
MVAQIGEAVAGIQQAGKTASLRGHGLGISENRDFAAQLQEQLTGESANGVSKGAGAAGQNALGSSKQQNALSAAKEILPRLTSTPFAKGSAQGAGMGPVSRAATEAAEAANAKAGKNAVSSGSASRSGAAGHEADGDSRKRAGAADPDDSAAALAAAAIAAVAGQSSAATVAGKGLKSGIAPAGSGKPGNLRGHELKASATGAAASTSADGDGSAELAGAVAAVQRPALPTAVVPNSIAVTGVTASGANGAALTMHPFSSASGLAIDKVGGTAHQGGLSAGHGFYDELESANGAGLGEAKTLVSTPSVLEVGITGGAHGWLRVRAELEQTGEVTASLMASSAASADALHKQLGAMSAYLKSEVVGVSSLAVTAPEKSGGTQGLGAQANSANPGAAGGSGAGSSSQQRGNSNEKATPWAGLEADYASQAVPAALLGTGVGGWLNVRV